MRGREQPSRSRHGASPRPARYAASAQRPRRSLVPAPRPQPGPGPAIPRAASSRLGQKWPGTLSAVDRHPTAVRRFRVIKT
jgi:hypothetical protein